MGDFNIDLNKTGCISFGKLEEFCKLKSVLENDKVVGGIFMNLSKAFDCVPHDLLIEKLAAYSVDENLLYIYSYL